MSSRMRRLRTCGGGWQGPGSGGAGGGREGRVGAQGRGQARAGPHRDGGAASCRAHAALHVLEVPGVLVLQLVLVVVLSLLRVVRVFDRERSGLSASPVCPQQARFARARARARRGPGRAAPIRARRGTVPPALPHSSPRAPHLLAVGRHHLPGLSPLRLLLELHKSLERLHCAARIQRLVRSHARRTVRRRQ